MSIQLASLSISCLTANTPATMATNGTIPAQAAAAFSFIVPVANTVLFKHYLNVMSYNLV